MPAPAQDVTDQVHRHIVKPRQHNTCMCGYSQGPIEGYSAQVSDASYWHDLDLSTGDWIMRLRPAVVPDTSIDSRRCHRIKVIAIRRGRPPADTARNSAVKLVGKSSSTRCDDIIILDWPFEDTYSCVPPPPPVQRLSINPLPADAASTGAPEDSQARRAIAPCQV